MSAHAVAHLDEIEEPDDRRGIDATGDSDFDPIKGEHTFQRLTGT